MTFFKRIIDLYQEQFLPIKVFKLTTTLKT